VKCSGPASTLCTLLTVVLHRRRQQRSRRDLRQDLPLHLATVHLALRDGVRDADAGEQGVGLRPWRGCALILGTHDRISGDAWVTSFCRGMVRFAHLAREIIRIWPVFAWWNGLLICGLWVRFPPGSPLIPKDLATLPPADSRDYNLRVVDRRSPASPLIRRH
jgi:hypothetical protein